MLRESRLITNRRVRRSPTDRFPSFSIFSAACATLLILAPGSAPAQTWAGGGGTNTNWGTAANWAYNTLPTFNSSTTLTFGTGGTIATNETSRNIGCIAFSRDADFTINGTGTVNLYSGITIYGTQTAGRIYTIQCLLSFKVILIHGFSITVLAVAIQ